MSSAGDFATGRLWSLREMLDIQAAPFLRSVTELRHLIVITEHIDASLEVGSDDREKLIQPHVNNLITALNSVGARSALAPAERLRDSLADQSIGISNGELRKALLDIESRFADHLVDIKLMVLNAQEAALFAPADQLLSVNGQAVEGFSSAFNNAAFEIEEAAKCIAVERYTASVFHSMRAIEVGIRALCKFMQIPDATKPSEKNWGVILESLRSKIEERWPKKMRLPNSQGARIEALYATLDAIKNPWRNATMHVETIYAPHEAIHIARCTGMFMLELMKHCDEQGLSPPDSPADVNVTVGAIASSTGSVSC